ncbi:hypothetical protein HCN44_009930 [Aphidius gifuensis]|uniref:Mutator-like transposase domain-containing protein n=1 Tax=Aphidius gifuensis TaxID=684658 RepID=A0A835CUG0_APHGI|nr:hypothetical protein HCN44_009930 [Aphidius gifuensis]
MWRAKTEKKIFKWKNEIVSEQLYNSRLKQRVNGKKRKIKDKEEICEGLPEGIRHVDFRVIVENLYCIKCKENLFLRNSEGEKRRGLGSFLMIRCETCLYLNSVLTSQFQSATEDRQSMFDINARCALGAIHSGLGCTQLNKFLAVLNVPPLSQSIYKRYEKIIGIAVEAVAEESCLAAAKEERQLTVEKMEELKKLL